VRNLGREELEEWGLIEGDVYSEDIAQGLLEDDELSTEEAAFIEGYTRASEEEEEDEF
jgi:hypothetical protein